jgi:hypothetical protein
MTEKEATLREAQFQAKAELTNQGFKGLLAINGGAAIALGALLQALIGKAEAAPLLPYVLVGIGCCVAGVAFAGATFWLRYDQWQLEVDKGLYRGKNPKWRTVWAFARVSLACFGLGLAIAVIGGFMTLSFKASLAACLNV